jgi:hypothetical protein
MAVIDVSHDCEHGENAGPATDLVPVHEKAESSCCGAVLAEGGTDETGYTCTQCSQPTAKVMGPPTAHWTCKCGTRRSQVITQPVDVPAES